MLSSTKTKTKPNYWLIFALLGFFLLLMILGTVYLCSRKRKLPTSPMKVTEKKDDLDGTHQKFKGLNAVSMPSSTNVSLHE